MSDLSEYPTIEYRKPSDKALVSALTGAVVILTPDGHSVVITPAVARIIAANLVNIATLAEMVETHPTKVEDPLNMPYLSYGKDQRLCLN